MIFLEYDKTLARLFLNEVTSFVMDRFHSGVKGFSMSSLTFCSYTSSLPYSGTFPLHSLSCCANCLHIYHLIQFPPPPTSLENLMAFRDEETEAKEVDNWQSSPGWCVMRLELKH